MVKKDIKNEVEPEEEVNEVKQVKQKPIKQKKECSPELLERLKSMRILAAAKRRELGMDRTKAKALNVIKNEQNKLKAQEFDNTNIKKGEPKKEPV